MRHLPWVAGLALGVMGCTGLIEDPSATSEADARRGGGGGGIEAAPAGLLAPASGLRRLTVREYDDTVRDLLGDDEVASLSVLPQDARTPFDNDYTQQIASSALVIAAEQLAREAAARLVADAAARERVVGCTPSGAGDAACFRSFVERFGRRAFRRPLEADEVAAYDEALALGAETDDFYVAVATVVEAMLQDPSFLYRVEIGTPVDGAPGLRRLDDWEIATRLAYLVWGTGPDEWLLDLAAAGELRDTEQRRMVATVMLDDDRARARIGRFHSMWLGYEVLPFGGELAESMENETRALVERVIFDERLPWHALFEMDETWLDASLAEHYGLPPPAAASGGWVPYGDSGRRGLLSHGTFLTNGAQLDDTNPVQRGLAVQSRLFCREIPPPPPTVNVDDAFPSAEEVPCKQDRFAIHRTGGCASCHAMMDPIGFGLEQYDHRGRYREHDEGLPECVITGDGEVAEVGTFNGPAELGELAIASGRIDACMVEQLYRFVVGRGELDENDLAMVERLAARTEDDSFRFDDLLLDVVASEEIAYRREEP